MKPFESIQRLPKPTLTLAMCTRNRARSLKRYSITVTQSASSVILLMGEFFSSFDVMACHYYVIPVLHHFRYVNLAAALTSIQDWEGAIQAHLDALSINGNLFGVRSDLGNIFKSLGRLDEAEVCRVESFKFSLFPLSISRRLSFALTLTA